MRNSFQNQIYFVIFEVYMAVTMKNAVFWDVAPCSSSETSVHTRTTRRHIPENGIFQIYEYFLPSGIVWVAFIIYARLLLN
jgi:hypothetical protein